MPKNKLSKQEEQFFTKLGKKIRSIILKEKGYQSLDSFALENHEIIAKPTLYAICDGQRDFQFSTLIRLAHSLDTTVQKLLEDI